MNERKGLFPIFVKLSGRSSLVVGGGALAEAKVALLLEAGASVLVVAPRVSDAIERWASERQIVWHERAFVASDVASVDIVFAATGKPGIDRSVAAIARQARVLVNAVDDPDFCDFYMPAVVRRGDLQIAISTNGHSPALAQQLRQHLETEFDDGWAKRLLKIGERRREIIAATEPGTARTAELQQLAREAVKELLR
jgi:precorrin-2 dehydrogenase / sirohydrochlorin ferrochelatase